MTVHAYLKGSNPSFFWPERHLFVTIVNDQRLDKTHFQGFFPKDTMNTLYILEDDPLLKLTRELCFLSLQLWLDRN